MEAARASLSDAGIDSERTVLFPTSGDQEVPGLEDEASAAVGARRAPSGKSCTRLVFKALAFGTALAVVALFGILWRGRRSTSGGSLRHAIQAAAVQRQAESTTDDLATWSAAVQEVHRDVKLLDSSKATREDLHPPLEVEVERSLVDEGHEVSFDCNSNRDNWRKSWSIWKKRWCCTQTGGKFGCYKHLSGSCHVRNVRYSLLSSSSMADLHDKLDHEFTLVLDEVANTPFDANDVSNTPTVVHVDLQEYADVQDNTVVHFEMGTKKDDHLHRLFSRVTAEHIVPALTDAIKAIQGISEVATESIQVTHCKINHQVTKLLCSCANGVPVNETCPAKGGEICESCFEGYDLEHQQCRFRECQCDKARGVAAVGPACPRKGFNFCGKCKQGFHLMRNIDNDEVTCEDNHCFCDFGIAVAGPACAEDKAQICESCNEGYHVDDMGLCKPNECYCTNGKAPSKGDKRCKDHGSEACTDDCFDFHHLDAVSGTCEMNTCSCNGGTPAVGNNGVGCRMDKGEACADCNGDLFLRSDGKCGQKQCFCDNGVPETGDKCVTHKGNICNGCKLGYQLSRTKQCVVDEEFSKDQCFCQNGKPVKKKACTRSPAKDANAFEKGDQVLTFYDEDWHECDVMDVDFEKSLYKLMCSTKGTTHDISVEPWRVTRMVEHACSACHTGYKLDETTGTCVENACICQNGEPAKGGSCFLDGLEVCSTCKPGFHHEFSNDLVSQRLIVKCLENRCYCDHGIPADTKPPVNDPHDFCHTQHEQICRSCTSGYGLTNDYLCKFKQCTCKNGVAANGPQCYKHGDEDCTSCRDDFHLYTPDPFMGVRHCRSNDVLANKPFDCKMDSTNSFLGWSALKKHWCCQNENAGCLVSATQEEACAGHRLSERMCKELGCCAFTAGQCIPKDRNEEMCQKGWAPIMLDGTNKAEDPNEQYPNGLCISADEPYLKFGRVTLRPCNVHDRKMLWSYFAESLQVKNMLGHCATRDTKVDPHEVRVQACDAQNKNQMFEMAQSAVTVGEFTNMWDGVESCITAAEDLESGAELQLGACSSDSPVQMFNLPSTAYVEHGSADSVVAVANEGEGVFKVGDKVVADTTGAGEWDEGVVEKVNKDGSYMLYVGGFPYNDIPEQRLSMAEGFHPTWEVQYIDGEKSLDAVVRRRDPDGTYEIQLTETGEIQQGVPKAQVKQIHAFRVGQVVKVMLHGTWFPGKVEAQQASGVYDVRLDADHSVEASIPQSQISLAKGFKPGAKIWYKDLDDADASWDPKWKINRKEGSGAYEISDHEGNTVLVTDTDALSWGEEKSYPPGTEVSIPKQGGTVDEAVVVRRYSDGSYAVLYPGHVDETFVDAAKITVAGTTTQQPNAHKDPGSDSAPKQHYR